MKCCCFRGLMVVVATLSLAGVAQAQYGGTSSSGMFGNRSQGGSTQFGGSGAGGSTGLGSMGGAGGAGGGSGAGTGATGGAAALTGSERFLRENRQGAFVGADSADTGNRTRSLTGGQAGGLQGLGGLGGQNPFQRLQQQFQNQAQNGQGAKKQLRIRLTLANTGLGSGTRRGVPVVVPTSRVTTGFQNRLARLPELQLAGPVQATLDGPTLVLRGTVATEGDRQMIEDLASLEPEVGQVRNELVVRSATPLGETLPGPTNVRPQSAR